LIQFYKRFIFKFSQRSAPLRDLLSKEVSFKWGDAQEKSFQDLIQALLSPPILRFPDVSCPFHLQCDASLQGLSYVLGQTDDDGRKYVISYGGRGLRPCEKKWPVTQLECLSLLTGIREYHFYLAAAPFVVYTDHASLKFLQSLKFSAHNRLARWALALQPYNVTVEHVPGKRLTAADGLSRRPYDEPDNLEHDEELQEDSCIVQMDPNVFDSVTDNALKVKQEERQWHVFSLSIEEDKKDHQSVTDSQTRPEHDNLQNVPASSSAAIDLWFAQE